MLHVRNVLEISIKPVNPQISLEVSSQTPSTSLPTEKFKAWWSWHVKFRSKMKLSSHLSSQVCGVSRKMNWKWMAGRGPWTLEMDVQRAGSFCFAPHSPWTIQIFRISRSNWSRISTINQAIKPSTAGSRMWNLIRRFNWERFQLYVCKSVKAFWQAQAGGAEIKKNKMERQEGRRLWRSVLSSRMQLSLQIVFSSHLVGVRGAREIT